MFPSGARSFEGGASVASGLMAEYQSLYRKHRPQTFGELVGQEHVTAALRNAVKDGRVGHAYLFSGPRGTGKTTTARILAKGLNCLALGADGEPCGTCENCVGIAGGRFLDLFELDAASNNSVDNIRDLTDSVHLGVGPTTTKKVYLIDEVHMLSAAASNALLKTLEEPPGHVVFVLATTNPEKVLPTIRSRTQHFEFTLLTPEQLTGHLADVLAREGVESDPEALPVIARAAAGSARDALSLLDQVLAHGADRIDAATVAELFGRTPFALRAAVLESIAAEDPAGALAGVNVLFDAGHDARRVAEDLLRATRDAFLVTAGAGRVRIDAPDDELTRLGDLGSALGNPLLVRAIETLGQAVVDMRGSDAADPQLVLEVALVRLARRDAGPPLQALADRVERLERAGAGQARTAPAARPAPEHDDDPDAAVGLPPTGPAATLGALRKAKPGGRAKASAGPLPEPQPEPQPQPQPQPRPRSAGAEAAVSDAPALALDDVILAWAATLPELPVATRSAVQEAQPLSVEGDVIVFGIPPRLVEVAKPRFKRNAEAIREALSGRLGRSLRFTLVAHDFAVPAEAPRDAAPSSPSGVSPPRPPLPAADVDYDDELGDPADLLDLSAAERAVDSVSMLEDQFGASVVEERPRD